MERCRRGVADLRTSHDGKPFVTGPFLNLAVSQYGSLSGEITDSAGTTTGTPKFLVGMGSTSVQITYPDFFNGTVNSKHEPIGRMKAQGCAREYVEISYYGIVTLDDKTSGQVIEF